MTLYRDPLAGLRSQIATKRGLLESHERRMPLLLRALLPARLSEPIHQLRQRALAEGDSLERLSDADAALDTVLAAYEEGFELLPSLRACPEEVSDPPRPRQAPPWTIEEERQKQFRLRFDQRARDLAPDTYLVRWGDETYLARLHVGGAPLVATARIDTHSEIVTHFWSTLRTSLPPSTPLLHVRQESTLSSLGRVLGVVEDRRIGNKELDEAFVVGGSEAATALLTSDVIAGLLALLPFNPSLQISRGVLELTWLGRDRGHATDLLSDDALAVVLGVRAAIERI